jgi:hypothetical protein
MRRSPSAVEDLSEIRILRSTVKRRGAGNGAMG